MTTREEKRGARGTGTVFWDQSKKTYRGEISFGYKANGDRDRIVRYGKTKAVVRDKLRLAQQERESGITADSRYRLKQAVDDWMNRYLRSKALKTQERLKGIANTHVIPLLGHAKLKELTVDDLDNWLDKLSATQSTNSLRKALSIVRRSITEAQRRKKITFNVAELVEIPEGQPGRPSRSMTIDQAKAVIHASKGTWMHAYLVVSILTGVRAEEIRPLKWKHVHIHPTPNVPAHIEVWQSTRESEDTKTDESRRTLALPPLAVQALEELRQQQQGQWRRRNGSELKPTDYVFGTRNGTIKSAGAVRRTFQSVLRKARISEEFVPRETRHTFVSIMSMEGASDQVIADVVGHRRTSTTRTVYRHQLRPVITEGADIIGDVFNDLGHPLGHRTSIGSAQGLTSNTM